ncbi:MAG: HAMP domain-containing sensor histidine kinase, partial [Nitrososphaerales archaeon]
VTSVPSAIVLGLVMSSSISKPIRKLRENLKEMADGNLDIKVKLQGNEEVLALCESINSMVNKLKTHDKLQKEFISIASHELRSPIQPILSFADLANKGHISNEQAWSSVLTQARRLQRLANDILYVTRIESGELTYNMKRVPIDEIIVEAMTAEKANLNEGVSMDAQLNANVEIYADRNRLGQALTNVIGNAVKFTKKGYVRVESRLLPGKSKIEIKVSDTAGGIPEDILPKLFEKFVTKNIGNENQHGTGLGLFISKAIITAHRGEITVYNNNGGATFVIVLPVK